MLGESIKRKNEELENLLDINPQQYQRSPYQVKIMKVKPKIIYPKHEQDHAFLFSEASKGNIDVYNCSHTYMYGNLQSKDQLSISQRSQKSEIDVFTLEDSSQVKNRVNLESQNLLARKNA